MRRFLLALTVSAVLGSPLYAQISFPVYDPSSRGGGVQNVVFQPAKDASDYRHGTLLSLTLNDGKNVTGTLVRNDARNNRLYLRTKPTALPVAYSGADVKSVEKGMRKPDLSAIVPAADAGAYRIPVSSTRIAFAADVGPETVVQPEISKQTIYGGTRRSVRLYSNVVSPGERELLEQMERAENDLLALEAMAEQRDLAISTEIGLQAARANTQKLINDTLFLNLQQILKINDPVTLETDPYYPMQMNLDRRQARTNFPLVIPSRTLVSEQLPAVSPESLSKAREAYRLSMNRGVYEDGRLVAVVYDDSK